MTSTTPKHSTAADLRDELQLTRWDDVKWFIGYRVTRAVLERAAERLKMLGERAAGEQPSTFAEDTQRNYSWGYKIGLGNGIVAAMTEWDCYDGSQEPHCDGAPAAWVYCLAREHGLDGAAIVQRVADAARRRRGEEPAR